MAQKLLSVRPLLSFAVASLLCIAATTAQDSYVVEDAGTAAANGTYTFFGNSAGNPVYRKGTTNLYIYFSGADNAYVIDDETGNAGGGVCCNNVEFLYVNTTEGTDPAGSYGFNAFTTGATPAPTVTAGGLPVELASFDAVTDGDDVLLRWSTATELNNSGFWVEQKSGESFVQLDFVEGHGTTLEAQQYQFRAEDLEPGRYTFRLKQVDYDGAFEYGPEVVVDIALLEGFRLSNAYPNPFNPKAQFELMLTRTQHVRVEMVDAQGRIVQILHDGPLEAQERHRMTLDGTGLPSGLYLYRVQGEDFRESRPIVLLK